MGERCVFVAGGTGYLGRAAIRALARRGHRILALVRPGSEQRLPPGCQPVPGDALDAASFASQIAPCDTFLQLVGTPHPGPGKARLFRSVDLASALAAIEAASQACIAHFVYVSVAHPAPVMRAYWEARAEAEGRLAESRLSATILRPWYVLGPGHRWPYLLVPGYALLERLPATRETARRLGLVTLSQMTGAIVAAVESPAAGIRVLEVPEIRASAQRGQSQPKTPAVNSP